MTTGWVSRHPDSAHHVCAPRKTGTWLPTLSDRGLAVRFDRHAGRSERLP
jgi:hypothetical protein